MVRLLLQRGACPKANAIIAATKAGHTDAVKLFINHNYHLIHTHELLDKAVINGHVDTVRLMIDYGAVPHNYHVAMALGDGKLPSRASHRAASLTLP